MNIRVLNNLSGGFGPALKQRVEYIRTTKYADRFTVFANGLDGFRDVEAGYGRKAAAQLEEDVRNGAIGFKIFKQTGMDTLKKDGTRLKINDPELAPLWDTAARLNIPSSFTPASRRSSPPAEYNERCANRSARSFRAAAVPNTITFEELNTAQRSLPKHPKTRFISAHFGWHANTILGLAARLLDSSPNGPRAGSDPLRPGAPPRAARDFFVTTSTSTCASEQW